MLELTILGVVFTVLLFFGVPVSFCIVIATLLALLNVTPDLTTAFVVSAQHNPLLRTDGFRYSLPILRNMENKIQPINQILKL